jgi:hypothetical protein
LIGNISSKVPEATVAAIMLTGIVINLFSFYCSWAIPSDLAGFLRLWQKAKLFWNKCSGLSRATFLTI